jgi:hypothetical protein
MKHIPVRLLSLRCGSTNRLIADIYHLPLRPHHRPNHTLQV